MKKADRRIRKRDIVSWKSGRNTLYGEVVTIKGDTALVRLRGDGHWNEAREVALTRLRYEPPVELSVDDLRRFCRFEITHTELKQGRMYAEIDIPETYQITPEDLKAAVENYHSRGISEEEFGKEYFWPLWDEIYNGAEIETAMNGPYERDEDGEWIPDQYTVFENAWDIFLRVFEYGEEEDADLDEVISEVQIWLDNRDKPLEEREFSR